MIGAVRKGAWTEEEDSLLRKCVENYGEGKWHQVPLRAGLNRCRKSCRLRWLNYLRPNIKRGNFSNDEVDLIVRLHNLLGNRWSLIAGRLPGRTANDVKNYWNTHQTKKCKSKQDLGFSTRNPIQASTIRGGSKVLKPRPRIFIKHNNIPCVATIPNTNNGSFKRIPSNESIPLEGLPSSPPLENNATEFFDGLFQNVQNVQNDGKELWSPQLSGGEEVMKRFWSEDIAPLLAGNDEVGNNEVEGDSNTKDKENPIFWDNDINESSIDMDIWAILGYTQDHVDI